MKNSHGGDRESGCGNPVLQSIWDASSASGLPEIPLPKSSRDVGMERHRPKAKRGCSCLGREWARSSLFGQPLSHTRMDLGVQCTGRPVWSQGCCPQGPIPRPSPLATAHTVSSERPPPAIPPAVSSPWPGRLWSQERPEDAFHAHPRSGHAHPEDSWEPLGTRRPASPLRVPPSPAGWDADTLAGAHEAAIRAWEMQAPGRGWRH